MLLFFFFSIWNAARVYVQHHIIISLKCYHINVCLCSKIVTLMMRIWQKRNVRIFIKKRSRNHQSNERSTPKRLYRKIQLCAPPNGKNSIYYISIYGRCWALEPFRRRKQYPPVGILWLCVITRREREAQTHNTQRRPYSKVKRRQRIVCGPVYQSAHLELDERFAWSFQFICPISFL